MTTAPVQAAERSPLSAAEKELRDHKAKDIVRRDTLWSMGVGLVPAPILDLVGLTAIQIRMLRSLAKLYDVEYSDQRAKSLLAALLSGAGTLTTAALFQSLIKFVPIIGHTTAVVSMPVAAGAATYVVGNIFVQHFEAGGTLLDFKPAEFREYFRKEYEKAKDAVKDLQTAGKAGAKG